MIEDKNDIDLREFFQNRFEDENEEPPRIVWTKINSNISNNNFWFRYKYYFLTTGVIVFTSLIFVFKNNFSSNKNTVKNIDNRISKNNSSKDSSLIYNYNQKQNQHEKQENKLVSTSNNLKSSKKNKQSEKQTTNKKTIRQTNSISSKKRDKEFSFKQKNIVEFNDIKNYQTEVNKQNSDENLQNDLQNDLQNLSLNNENTINKDTIEIKQKKDSVLQVQIEEVKKDSIIPIISPTNTFTKWTIDLFAGFGANRRTIIANENTINSSLAEKSFRMRNRTFGIGSSYAWNKFFSVYTGLTFGNSRKSTRIFEKTFEKKTTDYEFETSEGLVRVDATKINENENVDSIKIGIRFNHSSNYLSIPLALKINIPTKIVTPYFKIGASFDLERNRKTTVDIIRPLVTRTHLINSNKANYGKSFQGIIAFGASTNNNSKFNFYLEQFLSIGLTPYIKRPNFDIKNSYFQFRFGINYQF